MVAVIEVDGVSKSFGVPVIVDMSVSVEAGDALGIVGPNGAGKTTLLNLIAGDLAPDRGRVLLNGNDVTGVSADRRCRSGLARTSQVPRPFEGMSVLENVLLPCRFSQHRLAHGAGEIVVHGGLNPGTF